MEHLFHQWNVKLLPLSVNMWKARHTVIACGRPQGIAPCQVERLHKLFYQINNGLTKLDFMKFGNSKLLLFLCATKRYQRITLYGTDI